MAALHERLKALRTALQLSQREFAKRVYISQSFYAEMELGNRNINERIIHLIASHYNVNKDWLKSGAGAMFSAAPPDAKLEQLVEIFNKLDDMLQDYLLLQSKELLRIQKEKIDIPPTVPPAHSCYRRK